MTEAWEEVYDQPDPRKVNEVPSPGWVFTSRQAGTPETELQALMETAPGHEPHVSTEAKHAQADGLEILLEYLDENERAVIEATIIAGHSIRKAGQLLGLPSTTVHRIQQSALNRLRTFLENK